MAGLAIVRLRPRETAGRDLGMVALRIGPQVSTLPPPNTPRKNELVASCDLENRLGARTLSRDHFLLYLCILALVLTSQ